MQLNLKNRSSWNYDCKKDVIWVLVACVLRLLLSTAEEMGKKIQSIGNYNMDDILLGKGAFARVELATHTLTEMKVRSEQRTL